MKSFTHGAMASIVAALIVCVGSARGQMMGYAPQGGNGYGGVPTMAVPQPAYQNAPFPGASDNQAPPAPYGAPNGNVYAIPAGAPGAQGGEAAGEDGGQEAQGDGGPCIRCGNCYCPRWTATADGLWMTRWGGHTQPLIQGPAPVILAAPAPDFLNTTGLNSNWAGGPQVDVIYHRDCKWDLEFAGFQMDGFHAMDAEFSPGGLFFNAAGISTGPNSGMEYDSTSKVYSAEFDLRHPVSCNLTLFGGFRWVELQETLNGETLVGGLPGATFLNTFTDNHMYGLQLGADGTLWAQKGSPFRIDGKVKAGIYLDHGDQITNTLAAESDHAAFIGEASLTATYQLSKNVAARVGCQTMWLQGVALAGNQLMTTNVAAGAASVDMSGGLFYLGAFSGLEVDY